MGGGKLGGGVMMRGMCDIGVRGLGHPPITMMGGTVQVDLESNFFIFYWKGHGDLNP